MEAVANRMRALPWRDVERPALVMFWVAGLLLAGQAITLYVRIGAVSVDALAYYLAGQGGPLYELEPGELGAFNYSPAFAQMVWPLARFPWWMFGSAWVVAEVGAFVWLFRPLGWRWVVPLTLCCVSEWLVSNVVAFVAVAVVLGMRCVQSRAWDLSSGWWAAVALVKPTIALGPVWFAARGEWRKVGVSAAVTVAVVALSYAVWPEAWSDWLAFLTSSAQGQGDGRLLLPRLALALVLTVVGSRRDVRWLLVVALLAATPVWSGAASLTILAAIPRLVVGEGRRGGVESSRRPATGEGDGPSPTSKESNHDEGYSERDHPRLTGANRGGREAGPVEPPRHA